MMRKVLALSAFGATMAFANAQIVTNLEQGGKIFWKFNSGQFIVTGALNTSGSVSASDPLEFPLQDLNGDGRRLDVRLCLQDVLPNLGIEYCIDLIATVQSESPNQAIVRWAAAGTPNQCVNVTISGTTVQVLITQIEGALQARITPIPCRSNPYNPSWQNVTLQFEENGGDPNNFLRVKGYLFCFVNPNTFAQAEIFNMDWEAYGGGFTGVFGNVNGDNVVDIRDILQILFNLGSNDRQADANGDGVVDGRDMLQCLFNLGQSCGS